MGLIRTSIRGRKATTPGARKAASLGKTSSEHTTGSGSADLPDEQLVRAYVKGDREALRQIVDRYQVDLMRFLIRLTGSRDAAEDAFQETFLQFHVSASRFDTSRRLRPWLFTIAANKARDGLRKKSRQPLLVLTKPVGEGEGTEMVDLLEIDIPAPSAGMLSSEQQELVDRAVSQLSHPLREVLLLAYFQRLSYAQIAEELGIPLGTVKSRLHAAVASFAKFWQQISANSTSEDWNR
ncbi:MAG: sigma-70 family RNA polymerase sigma factor [Planctomycetota bacterium]